MRLGTNSISTPYFGPRVFEDAQRCPALASIALMGRSPTPESHAESEGASAIVAAKMDGGGWMAAMTLLKALAYEGKTTSWASGTHAAQDLTALAMRRIPNLPAGVREFAVTTVEGLLEAQAETSEVLPFVPGFISRGYRGGTLHAGGVFLFAAGNVTQVWRLILGSGRSDRPQHDWALTAAYAVAESRRSDSGMAAHRVSVHEFHASDGSSDTIASWTLEEVEQRFTAELDPRLASMAHNLTVTPGAHCSSCRFVAACPAVPHTTGLLPGVPRQPQVTTVSPSDLKSFGVCPARYDLLSVQGLSRTLVASSTAMARGSTVDAWLTAAHSNPDAGRCAPPEVPLTDNLLAREPAVAATLETLADRPSQEYDDALNTVVAMLRQHESVCPVRDADPHSHATQRTHALLDLDTQILLVTRPDSEYTVQGTTTWRETKTRAAIRPRLALDVVQEDLAAGAYVLTLHAIEGTEACLEWEELSSEAGEVTVLLCDDTEMVDRARHIMAGAVADLLRDEPRQPRPGVACQSCAASRWCPAGGA